MDTHDYHVSAHQSGPVPPHRHGFGYAALVLTGGYTERAPEGVWICEAGDLILHPAFHLHSNDVCACEARVLNIELPHRAAAALDYGVYRLADPAPLLRTPGCRETLASVLAQAHPKAPAPAQDWREAFAHQLAQDPLQSISALAAHFGVSAAHASRAFHKLYAMTPAVFRAEHRLRSAVRALGRAAPLAQVAQESGYADQAHMTRAFTAAFSLTPARLRAALA